MTEQAIEDGDLYFALGLAVHASQIFEASFVMAGRLAFMQSELQSLKDVLPISLSRSFKQPLKALLRELQNVPNHDPELHSRIEVLIEERNKIVHRLFLEDRWPSSPEKEKRLALFETCVFVAKESAALTECMRDILLNWKSRFPEFQPFIIKFLEIWPR